MNNNARSEIQAAPEPPASVTAARALPWPRNSYDGATLDPITVQYALAAGVLAIAEQLNLLNDNLIKMDR